MMPRTPRSRARRSAATTAKVLEGVRRRQGLDLSSSSREHQWRCALHCCNTWLRRPTVPCRTMCTHHLHAAKASRLADALFLQVRQTILGGLSLFYIAQGLATALAPARDSDPNLVAVTIAPVHNLSVLPRREPLDRPASTPSCCPWFQRIIYGTCTCNAFEVVRETHITDWFCLRGKSKARLTCAPGGRCTSLTFTVPGVVPHVLAINIRPELCALVHRCRARLNNRRRGVPAVPEGTPGVPGLGPLRPRPRCSTRRGSERMPGLALSFSGLVPCCCAQEEETTHSGCPFPPVYTDDHGNHHDQEKRGCVQAGLLRE